MSSLFSVYKSQYARKRFANSELTYLLGYYLKVDIRIPYSVRAHSATKIDIIGARASYVTVRNRCIWTGRARAVFRRTHLCRMSLKELSLGGMLPGFCKASW
jgi:ribosomal protein S14